ncbi:hypothetical protein B5X24_HaOG200890 [Helicoverpa armigera]|uniref:Gustatory receptor n=1 Tax=Helicoverpa armigera TaxID=29058 RepID=A0A2W1BAE8_HELAM|nr:hypothetical protein B5X24_HaOG200890 [Helicoverpa armigera]
MIGDSLVCNIKYVIWLRFAFGYLPNFHGSPKMRAFSYFYTIFLFISFTTIVIAPFYKFPWFFRVLALLEYTTHFLLAFVTKDDYLYQSFRFIYGIDTNANVRKLYRNLEVFFKFIILYFLANKILVVMMLCYRLPSICLFSNTLDFSVNIIIRLACDMGRFTVILSIGLLYVRSKILKMNFLTQSPNTICGRHSVRNFINMYESLINTFDKIKTPTNITVCFVITY